MSVQTRAILKNFFKNGDEPTEQQFADLIDSLLHINDPIATGSGGTFASSAEAQQGVVNNRYMNPLLTKEAIYALARLANIPQLESEVDVKDTAVTTTLRGGVPTTRNTLNKLNNVKEDTFTKNSAFNQDYGTATGQVARGNHSILRGVFRIISHSVVGMGNVWKGSLGAGFLSLQHVPSSYFKYRINHNYGSSNYLAFMSCNVANSHAFITITDKSSNYIEFELRVYSQISFTGFSPAGPIDIDFQLLEMDNY